MNHTDIQLAVSRRTITGLEEAFLALAIADRSSIKTVKGNEISAVEKRNLLRQVCEALKDDDRLMPGDACEALDLLPGNTYAAGVARALTLAGEPN